MWDKGLVSEGLVQIAVWYQMQTTRAYEILGVQLSGLSGISFVSLFGFHETLNPEKGSESSLGF